ncbi:conserved hypothetical protein [Hymenobacter roseosalivarius DSM 11622]|uniref:DUF4394 domain-containing protein n=1 Tax=Hymenobacter roseosalivarius DSM 11622 TaxID=645990 RepID=A0A1W1W3J5_9BACT|nr:DUF4394 domain-containing protein [Hymenobacter roseosalivarius]SMC00197.1 conserved hypothetical protein [Hymenobacter roseosalivarius DSM 11622]
MQKPSSLAKWGAAVLLLSSLSSCEDILEQYFPKPTPPPPTIPTFPNLGLDIPFYALSGGTKLDAYSTKDPATRTNSVSVTGLGSGETLLAIDFRPATGQLYGVSSASRLYVINQNTGAARAVGTGAFTPAVAGNLVGFDFNPTVDRIRLVTSTGQNLRLNPETGTVAATDGAINGAANAALTGAAYTNNTNGVTTTALYAINSQNQQLYLVNPPNDGTLVPVGSLNLNVSGDGGFDIDAKTGTALGLYPVNGKPTLFAVDLTTGAARSLAQYAANLNYSGIAIPTQPVAYSAASFSGPTYTLYSFDPTNPTTILAKPIIGLQGSVERDGGTEFILELDFRPATGQLYALVRLSSPIVSSLREFRLYTINPATGAATFVGYLNGPRVGEGPIPRFTNLPSSEFGIDFDPVTDQLRLVGTHPGVNVVVNPNTGLYTQDRNLNPGQPGLTAAAYSNNFAGATSTNFYVIDTNTNKLNLQNPASAGTQVAIGDLGINANFYTSFDISGITNTGYVATSTGSGREPISRRLYTINLATGATTKVSDTEIPGVGLAVGLGF